MAAESIRVYVGACSLTTAYGHGISAQWDAMSRGVSALMPMTYTPVGGEPTRFHGQRITDEPPTTPDQSRLERLMVRDAHAVVTQSGIDTSDARTGLIISTTKGNIAHVDAARQESQSDAFLSILADKVANALGVRTQPIVVSNACISGVVAIIAASRLVRAGIYDNILVVGADEMTDFITSGFIGFRSVSAERCRPYDISHCGLSLGEASGCMLVTRSARLSSGITIGGGSMTDDANHISGPSRTGEPLAMAIRQAMEESKLISGDISFVNAHGTGTVYNDEMEAKAINIAGLGEVPVNSLKPFVGHTLGASGLIEAIMCCEELRRHTILPTLGFEEMGGDRPLNIRPYCRTFTGNHCIKSASGFGGCNAAIVLSADQEHTVASHEQPQFEVAKQLHIADGKIVLDNNTILDMPGSSFAELIREAYHRFAEPNMKFFKMDDLSKLGYVGAEILLRGRQLPTNTTCIALSNRSSSLDTDCTYSDLMKRGEASPAKFVYTLPNIVIGEICIRHKICGETIFTIRHEADQIPEQQELSVLRTDTATHIVKGWCELFQGAYDLRLELLERVQQ